MKKKLILVCGIYAAMVTGCTENQRARNFGGAATETLPQGRKLVVATWKQDDLWMLTRPMKEGEAAEVYEFRESSSFGVMQGKVVITETK